MIINHYAAFSLTPQDAPHFLLHLKKSFACIKWHFYVLFCRGEDFFNNSLIINRKCYFMDFKDVVGINLIIYFFLPIFSIFYSQREDYIVWFKALTLISSGWNFYCFGWKILLFRIKFFLYSWWKFYECLRHALISEQKIITKYSKD